MPTPSMQINPRLEDERAAFVLASSEAIEAAAKAISACMDYPWEHMPEQGRKTMRRHAETVITAALSVAALNGADAGVSEGWQEIATAPKDGSRFLAFYNGRVEFFRWQESKLFPKDPVGWRDSFINVYREGTGPTHWQPLPSAPTQGGSHGE